MTRTKHQILLGLNYLQGIIIPQITARSFPINFHFSSKSLNLSGSCVSPSILRMHLLTDTFLNPDTFRIMSSETVNIGPFLLIIVLGSISNLLPRISLFTTTVSPTLIPRFTTTVSPTLMPRSTASFFISPLVFIVYFASLSRVRTHSSRLVLSVSIEISLTGVFTVVFLLFFPLFVVLQVRVDVNILAGISLSVSVISQFFANFRNSA